MGNPGDGTAGATRPRPGPRLLRAVKLGGDAGADLLGFGHDC